MNLKESYRYQNFLDRLLDTSYSYLRNKNYITTTTQEHMRKKANPDAENEIMDVAKPFDVEFAPNDIIDFVMDVLAEKDSVSKAIAVAKSNTEINIDNAIAMNIKRHDYITILESMVNTKPSETTVRGTGYRFNNEMNQVTYYYDVVQKTTIDFNRNDVKGLIKKLNRECDEISAKLDSIEINTVLDFAPKYDVNDKFEDIILVKTAEK